MKDGCAKMAEPIRSTCRIATLTEQEQATDTGNKLGKFGED